MKKKWAIITVVLIFMSGIIFETDSFARAGGGLSMGSRGSRTYSSQSVPNKPSTAPYTAPIPQNPTPSPGLFGGGFARSMMGGILGGMIGGLLFRSLGFAGDGFGHGGIGLFDILLLVGIGSGIYWWIKTRRTLAYAPTGGAGQPWVSTSSSPQTYSTPGMTKSSSPYDLKEGLRRIAAMDPQFKIESFKDQVTDLFFKVQIGWGKRELSLISKFLTPEMNSVFDREISRLKMEKKTNHIENISIRNVEIVEGWQEEGNDFITTLISANLLDYTKDDQSGTLISGSETEAVSFKEYWTFTRPVGNGDWILSAIEQV